MRHSKATPTSTSEDERRFKLLKQVYVDARYSMSYRITREDLEWRAAQVRELRACIERVCQERITTMTEAAVGTASGATE